MTLGAWWRDIFFSSGFFSERQHSVRATLLSLEKYQTYTRNHWITKSATGTIDVSYGEYFQVSECSLYPSDECEMRIRWKRYSISEHCFYLGLSRRNGKCQNGGEPRQHLNRKCVRWLLTSRQRLAREEHWGTRRQTGLAALIYQACNVKRNLQSGVSLG